MNMVPDHDESEESPDRRDSDKYTHTRELAWGLLLPAATLAWMAVDTGIGLAVDLNAAIRAIESSSEATKRDLAACAQAVQRLDNHSAVLAVQIHGLEIRVVQLEALLPNQQKLPP